MGVGHNWRHTIGRFWVNGFIPGQGTPPLSIAGLHRRGRKRGRGKHCKEVNSPGLVDKEGAGGSGQTNRQTLLPLPTLSFKESLPGLLNGGSRAGQGSASRELFPAATALADNSPVSQKPGELKNATHPPIFPPFEVISGAFGAASGRPGRYERGRKGRGQEGEGVTQKGGSSYC